MRSHILLWLCGAALLSLPGFAARVGAQAPAAEWTMMFYMDSDNDLEAPQMNDLKEMLRVGGTKEVNIIVLSDRHVKGAGKYTDEPVANLKNWTTAKLLRVETGRLVELGDWGEVNMGDPATLKRFVTTVAKQFPANRYGLVFGNHGAGWPGIVGDESHDHDSLTSAELPAVFKDTSAATGKLELIGFDACLMGNFEVAKAVAPYARAMVASEELEPGDGWNYTPLFQTFTKNPKMDGLQLGRIIADTFNDYFNRSQDEDLRSEGQGVTLSVVALDKLEPLEKAVNDFALAQQDALAKGGRAAWLRFAAARENAQEFGSDPNPAGRANVFDLLGYAINLKAAEPSLGKAADAIALALKDVVYHNVKGRGRPGATGLSIYFPPDKGILGQEGAFNYTQTAFSQTGKWLPFLTRYASIEAQDTDAPQLNDVATNDAALDKNDVSQVSAEVKGDDIDEINFVLAQVEGKEQVIIGSIPAEPDEKGRLSVEWDGAWFTIGDGKKEFICPIANFEELDDAQDAYWAEVPAQVKLRDTDEWLDVTLFFIVDFNGEEVVGDFVYAFENSDAGHREIDLDTGDQLRPVYYFIGENDEEGLIASDDKEDIITLGDVDDLKVGRDDVDPGSYLIGFVVTDYAGNTSESFTKVELE
jgi:hypothetical protein